MASLWRIVAKKEKRLRAVEREIARLESERRAIRAVLAPLGGGGEVPIPLSRPGRRRGTRKRKFKPWKPGGPGRPPKEWVARHGRPKKKKGKWRLGHPGRPPKAWVEAQKGKAGANAKK